MIIFLVICISLLFSACEAFMSPLVPFIDRNTGRVVGERNWSIEGENKINYCWNNDCRDSNGNLSHYGELVIPPGEDIKLYIPLRNLQRHEDISAVFTSTNDITDGKVSLTVINNNLIELLITNPEYLEEYEFEIDISTPERFMSTYEDLPKIKVLNIDASLASLEVQIPSQNSSELNPLLRNHNLLIYLGTEVISVTASIPAGFNSDLKIQGTHAQNDVPVSVSVTGLNRITVSVTAECGLTENYNLDIDWSEIPGGVVPLEITLWIDEDKRLFDITNPNIINIQSRTNLIVQVNNTNNLYSNFAWYLNGVNTQETSNTISFNTTWFASGTYNLNLVAYRDTIPYSILIQFTVIDNSIVFSAGTAEAWNNAVTQINSQGAGDYTINITDNFEISGTTGNTGTFGSGNVNVLITGDHEIKINSEGRMFRINSNQTVTVKDIKIISVVSDNKTNSLVSIYGGTFIMSGNSSVSGNIGTDASGGGVYVDNGGTFIMNDNASIYNNSVRNRGGGVFITGNSSVFIMNDNSYVYENEVDHDTSTTASYGNGGGVYVNGGTFTMNGGTIENNTASKDGASLYKVTAGIAVYGDGTSILPHTDEESLFTDEKIIGKK